MDAGKKLLLISFSSIPTLDQHSATVTSVVRALGRLFEQIDVVALKGEFLAHIERYYTSRLLRVPLVGDTVVERTDSFRRAVRRQIESETYDVVHVRSPLEGIPIWKGRPDKGYLIVYEASTFSVLDSIDTELHDEELLALDAQMVQDEVRCAEHADLVVVHSEAGRQTLRARGVSTPIELVPRGVNIDVFDWEASPRPEVPTALCLGRLGSWRDVPTVLEATRRVLEIVPLRLRWVGEPNAKRREAFNTYAAELGIDHAVSFEAAPEAEEVPQLLSAVTLGIAPAAPTERYLEWGDQPTGLLEYMACRLPVIAARVPGVEEIVRDGTEALLYPPGDADSLTSAVLFLIRNSRHRDLLAKRGYRRVREQFCESSTRRLTLSVYRDLLGLTGEGGAGTDLPAESTASTATDDLLDAAQEPITAVMEVAEESRRVRVGGDTSRVQGLPQEEEHYDTQPHIDMKNAQIEEVPEDDNTAWVLPETTPHAERPADLESVPPQPPSVTVEIEDTSRIVSHESEDSSDR